MLYTMFVALFIHSNIALYLHFVIMIINFVLGDPFLHVFVYYFFYEL